jgi:hypothetical protein
VQILSAKGAAVEAQGEKREVARRVWDVVLSGK